MTLIALTNDLVGQPVTPLENEVWELYQRLKVLAAQELDPCVASNVRNALVAMWNIVNDLALENEQLIDLGS